MCTCETYTHIGPNLLYCLIVLSLSLSPAAVVPRLMCRTCQLYLQSSPQRWSRYPRTYRSVSTIIAFICSATNANK